MPHGYFAATSGGNMHEEIEMMWADHDYIICSPDQEVVSREIDLAWLDIDQEREDDEKIEKLWYKITLDTVDAAMLLEIRGIEVESFEIAKGVALLHGINLRGAIE